MAPANPAPPNRPCPVCATEKAVEWGVKKELRLVRCAACSTVYEPALPAEFQAGRYYQTTGAEFYLSPDKLRSDQSPVRYTRELELFRARVPGGRIIDVGCGTGGFLNQLRTRHPGEYITEGTDVSGPALQHAESLGITIHRGSFTEGRLGAASYDAVSLWAVLEHLPDPAAFLREAFRLLKPGGLCFALVPNLESLAIRLLGMKYRYVFPQHINYFTDATLRALFQRTGAWTGFKTAYTHFNPIVIWQDFWRGDDFVPDEERAGLLVKTNAMKADARLGPARALYRLTESILAEGGLTDNVVLIARK